MTFDLYPIHNQFRDSLSAFAERDPQLLALSKLRYQYDFGSGRQSQL